jgi:hypothetical protein
MTLMQLRPEIPLRMNRMEQDLFALPASVMQLLTVYLMKIATSQAAIWQCFEAGVESSAL